MSRALHPDVALNVALSACCGRNRYTNDPAAVVGELRVMAGDRADILAQVAGTWAGYYRDQYTQGLCDALLEIPGAEGWVELGRSRKTAPMHGAPLVRPETPNGPLPRP